MINDRDDIDALLVELFDLEEKIEPILERMMEIMTWCKLQGSFRTRGFCCVIRDETKPRTIISVRMV